MRPLPRKREQPSSPGWDRKIPLTQRGWRLIVTDLGALNELTMADETPSYRQLQQQIHEALREQHPDWIEPNGDCPTCDSYESRLAELLDSFSSNERKSAA